MTPADFASRLCRHSRVVLLRRQLCFTAFAVIASALVLPTPAQAELSKGFQILISRGLQIHGLVQPDDYFHLDTFTNANYTAVKWLPGYTSSTYSWDMMSKLGPAPGMPWGRWVGDITKMPPLGGEAAYLDQLVSLSFSDEPALDQSAKFDELVSWFNATATNWPSTIRYVNNWGGQIPDSILSSFISQAHPDLISFDTYPWRCVYDTNAQNHIGAPIGGPDAVLPWYGELRRYRAWATTYNIPFGIYRQTFHSVEEWWPFNVYRDPSPSELRLNTFAALAFNAKMLIDFTYNSGATSLFDRNPEGFAVGDSLPNALYAEQADINRRARNLGKALVLLQPIYDLHNVTNTTAPGPASDDPNFPEGYTTSTMFLKGKYVRDGVTNITPTPNSFYNDPQSQSNLNYTWWEFGKNDPYLSGWGVTNIGTKNSGLPGDVIISWFRPLDEGFDGTNATNQVYMMVVNGLTDPTGTAADCAQSINLDFQSGLGRVIMLNPTTGVLETNVLPTTPTGGKKRLTLTLNGGDAALFKFTTNTPFVGFIPAQPARSSLQVQSNTSDIQGTFSLQIQGTIGARYDVQVTSSFSETNWMTLKSIVLPTSTVSVEGPISTNSSRFYRAVGVP